MMKGIIFTFDAVFALLIALAIVPVFLLISSGSTSETINQRLSLEAEDAINAISIAKVSDVINESVISELYNSGVVTEEDLDSTLLEFISKLWASNDTLNTTRAQDITQQIISKILPPNVEFSLSIEDQYVASFSDDIKKSSVVSRRVVSGFRKGLPSSGFVASASISNIGGKNAYSYYFFGGFVGQGNITFSISDMPNNSTVKEIYLELAAGGNFTLFANSAQCGTFNKTGAAVDGFTINSGPCVGSIIGGSQNNFTIIFTDPDILNNFIGGGFLRVNYVTDQLLPQQSGYQKIYLPGVNGFINYFDSFYVPGNITGMNVYLHFKNNYSTFFVIGNKTVLYSNGSVSDQNVNIQNATLATLLNNYTQINSATVPIRLGINASNATLSLVGTSNADVVLITDLSGSMNERLDSSTSTGAVTINDCSSPSLFNGSTRRISLAKCLDKDFVSAILNSGGNNRIALVAFSTSIVNNTGLTTDQFYLNNTINSYSVGGFTCVSCSINKAYDILNSQSPPDRQKFIIVMTDGVTNVRSTPICYDSRGLSSNSTNSLVAQAGVSGEIVHYTSIWNSKTSPTSSILHDVDVLNSTLGFAVGESYQIFRWNGTTWSLQQDLGSQDLYGVDVYNSTLAFAVGDSGKIARWNGNVWAEQIDMGNRIIRDVKILNSTFAFAVADNGEIYSWSGRLTGANTWTQYQDTGNMNWYAIDIYNGTFAFATGTDGLIYRWNGATWSQDRDLNTQTVTDVQIFNSTLAFATTNNNRVYGWNGSVWTNIYEGSYSLHAIRIVNSTLGFAIGDSREGVVVWNGNTWTRTWPAYLYSGNSSNGLLCNDNDACTLTESIPALNAEYSSCRAHDNIGATVHSIGFGPITSCTFANQTLQRIATCGNGTFYSSYNASELKIIYQEIAQTIVSQSYSNQSINISSLLNVTSSILYPDSYIEINYMPSVPQVGYQEIALQQETQPFSACNYTLALPAGIRVLDSKVTSFSGNLWTALAAVNSSSGYNVVYNLTGYGTKYTDLGDPFIVHLPENLLAINGTSDVTLRFGNSPVNMSPACPWNSRIIYTTGVRASVPFGALFNNVSGGNIRVYYDIDYDGVADGNRVVSIGSNATGFDNNIRTVDQLDLNSTSCDILDTNNALDDAFVRLLDALTIVNNPVCSLPGTQSNPINVVLSDINVSTTGTGKIPYPWGPLEVKLVVGV